MRVYLAVLLILSMAPIMRCTEESEEPPEGEGYYVYFSSDRDGPGIYATTTTGAFVAKLTSFNYTSMPEDIELSEDYSLIVYSAQPPTGEDIDLFKVDTSGNGEVNLTTASGVSSAAAEAPDFVAVGWVYFGSERSNFNGWYQAYRMRPDGTNTEAVSPQSQMWYTMTISPDRSRIILDNADNWNQHARIYAADPDGSNSVMVFETPDAFSRTHGSAWVPNTDKIVFAAGPQDGNYRLYIIDSDGSGLDSVGFYSANNWPGGQPWWGMRYKFYTNDGEKIVFSSNPNGNYDIYIQNLDGTGRTQLTTNSSDDVHPLITNDDQQILFISDRSGTRSIWMMDIDGSNKTQLTDDAGIDMTFRVGAIYYR